MEAGDTGRKVRTWEWRAGVEAGGGGGGGRGQGGGGGDSGPALRWVLEPAQGRPPQPFLSLTLVTNVSTPLRGNN